MKTNYKEEYRSTYAFTKGQLKSYSKQTMERKSKYIKRCLQEKQTSDLVEWSGDQFYKRVIANAQYNAIKDYKKEQNKKGLDILGRKLR